MSGTRNKLLEDSVVAAMDGSDRRLFPFLPYIFQDLWEFGSGPGVIIDLVGKHTKNYGELKVLDLGCGKGAVAIRVSKEFGCVCLGIDAIKEFIDEAGRKAKEYGVGHLCRFESGDIRERVKDLTGFDIVILGSIGPVFGDYFQTLNSVSVCLSRNGRIIIDDGYIESGSGYAHQKAQKREALLRQVEDSGMRIIDEVIIDKNRIKDSNDFIFAALKKRCLELIKKFPGEEDIFRDYIRRQEEENVVLEEKIICAAMVIGRNRR